MQLNNPKNSTSNLIKQSELAKKKARRRLIGSIFMLLTALIILLNVTAKVKPIPVNPKVIEISNNTSAPAKNISPTKPVDFVNAPVANASAPVNASGLAATNVAATGNNESAGTGFKAGVVGTNNATNAGAESATIVIKPIIITMNIDHKPSPEDILNGNLSSTSETIYYVQIATSGNKPELQKIQTSLSDSGIKSFVQNGKNNTYRLRAGAFKNKPEATDKLAQIKKSLNQ
jgi:hypothetical protein